MRGLCTHRSGVGLRGDVGPKAPMVLGTKRRKPCSAAMSRMLWSPEKQTAKRSASAPWKTRASSYIFMPTWDRLVTNSLTGDVNRACQGHVSLSNSTEEGAVVNQPSDAVVHHNFPQVLVVQDVWVDEGAWWRQRWISIVQSFVSPSLWLRLFVKDAP